MKTLILYYSLSGSTGREARRLGETLSADVLEVTETRRRGPLSAFFSGCPAAMGRKPSAVNRPDADLSAYDRIILGAPVWAGYPAPAFNAMVSWLPAGKEAEVFLCSAGGETPKSRAGTIALVESKGCQVTGYRDVRTSPPADATKK